MGLERPLGERTWTEVARSLTLLVPLGSTEQHGPHLPLDTDTRIATAVADAAAVRSPRTVVAPALPYGASGEHAGFAGTLSIGTRVLRDVVIELVRSAAETFDRVVFVNGHGGNSQAVIQAVEQMCEEGHEVAVWFPRVPGGDAHAGRTETSLMLAIAPELVLVDAMAQGNTEPLADIMGELRCGGVAAVSANGVLGDPARASFEHGEQLLNALADDLVALLGPSTAS